MSFFEKNKYQIYLSLVIIVGFVFIIVYSIYYNIGNELGNKDKPFYLRNIIIGLAAIATAIFTWWKNTINQSNNIINRSNNILQENTRLDTLFAKAVDYLNEKNDLTTRNGGVYILKDLGTISIQHSQKCIDMLCSLSEKWFAEFLKSFPEFFIINDEFLYSKDIKKLILYIDEKNPDSYGRGKEHYVKEISETTIINLRLYKNVLYSLSAIIRNIDNINSESIAIDLSNKYICGLDLSKCKLTSIDFENSILHSAKFEDSILINTNFMVAELQKSNFMSTNNNNSNFIGAKLEGTNFAHALLDNSNLSGSKIKHTQFYNSKFPKTNLYDLKFIDANIEKANFTDAILKKADFRDAENVEKAIFGSNKSDAIFTDEDYELKKYII